MVRSSDRTSQRKQGVPARNVCHEKYARNTKGSSAPASCYSTACTILLAAAIAFVLPWAIIARDDVSQGAEEMHDEHKWPDDVLKSLHVEMMRSEEDATGNNRSLVASRRWLESALAVDEHLVVTGAPVDIRAYTLSEIQRIALNHFQWNDLMNLRDLLGKAAPCITASMLDQDEIRTCCTSDSCLYNQVTTAMILEELDLAEHASAHLLAAKSAVIAAGGNPFCRGMTWQLNRLSAPLDTHFPLGYERLVDVESHPPFWASSELPLARHLEKHSEEIVAELSALCPPERPSAAAAAQSMYFGTEKVVKGLASGSWTSLPLLHLGEWNSTACELLAPRTCSLLKNRPELRGAMRSASAPDTIVHQTFASVYRLRPQAHIHRHVGTPWRLNTHLGIVTPPGASIRVWGHPQEWEVGKALSFLDAAEHEVVHHGKADRCVLNVVSWHPTVLERRLSDSTFAEHFALLQ